MSGPELRPLAPTTAAASPPMTSRAPTSIEYTPDLPRDSLARGARDGLMTASLVTLVGVAPVVTLGTLAGAATRIYGGISQRAATQALGSRMMASTLKGGAFATGLVLVGCTVIGGITAKVTDDPARGFKAGAAGGAILGASPFVAQGRWGAALAGALVGAGIGGLTGAAAAL